MMAKVFKQIGGSNTLFSVVVEPESCIESSLPSLVQVTEVLLCVGRTVVGIDHFHRTKPLVRSSLMVSSTSPSIFSPIVPIRPDQDRGNCESCQLEFHRVLPNLRKGEQRRTVLSQAQLRTIELSYGQSMLM